MKNPKNPESDIRILKTASCPSVSGKSTLTYHIGCTTDGEIKLRVYANTAAGYFSQEWLPLKAIDQVLIKAGSHFTSFALNPLFRGKSQNNTAFLLAVLLEEGLVKPSEKKRCYELAEMGRFMDKIKPLIDSKISLKEDDKPAKTAKTSLNADDKPAKKVTANKAKADKATGTESINESSEQDSPS